MGGDGQEKIGENNGMGRLGHWFRRSSAPKIRQGGPRGRSWSLRSGRLRRSLLQVIPAEILEKDYGCGDPSRFVKSGDAVLDLGSGSGKACYIISQIVGAQGKVIGVDFNPPMLELARKYQKTIGDKLGYHNVEFRRGKIQDLKTNLELVERYLQDNPVRSVADLANLKPMKSRLEASSRLSPMSPST